MPNSSNFKLKSTAPPGVEYLERSRYPLLLIVLCGLFLRLALAPYSAGSDLAQFYGFAGTMLEKKACFYAYADAVGFWNKGWPYPWPYVYGPVFAYILTFLRALVGGWVETSWEGGVYHVYVDPVWGLSVKLVLILADTVVALLLYLLLKGEGERKALLGSSLYYLNPMTIYVSAIYGMFDQLALVFFLLALYLSRERVSSFLYGFTLAVKHTLLFPEGVFLWDAILEARKGIGRILFFVAGILAPFLPMLACPSGLSRIPELMGGIGVGYTVPVSYSMNGLSSLATYLHISNNSDTLFLIKYWYVPAVILLFLVLTRHAFERDPAVSMALAYGVFVATYWRVNPQYLVPLIAFMVLFAMRNRGAVSVLAVFTVVYVAFWPLMQPTAFWFHVHMKNPNWWLVHVIDSLTFRIFDDGPYVVYSLGLTGALYLIIILSTLPYLKTLKTWLAEKPWVGS